MAVIDVACYTKEEYLNSIARCAAQTKKELQQEYDIQMKRWENSGRRGPEPVLLNNFTKSSAIYYFQLARDFAAISNLYQKYPKWTFYADEVYRINQDRVLDYSFYTIYLKTLVKSSTKLKKLEKILANMQGRLDKAMARGEPKEKIVCTTAHPAALGLLY